MHTLYIVTGIIVGLFLWAAIEKKLLIYTKYNITNTLLPKAFNGVGFVVLADLHNNCFGKNNERLTKKIDQLSPEFILVAGDMISKNTLCYPSPAFDLLDALSKRYPIYYSFGNHEQRFEHLDTESKEYFSWVEFQEKLKKKGVIFLNNKTIELKKQKDSILISGISIGQKFFERSKAPEMEDNYLSLLLQNTNSKKYHILLAHNPVYFSNYIKWGADLSIGGHLHGGMVRLPGLGGVISPQVKFFPAYSSGCFTLEDKHMVVSRGLGSHSFMPRLFNTPEIVYVIMQQKEQGKG